MTQVPGNQHAEDLLRCCDALQDRLSALLAELDAAMNKSFDAPVAVEPMHADDAAVDRFAVAMKAKLAYKRGQGYDGWDDKALCSQDDLSRWLREHVDKGDAVDVANFAMMLHQRGEWIVDPDADHATRTAQPQQDDEQ